MNNKLIVVLLIVGIVLVGAYLVYSTGPTVSAQGTASLEAKPDKVSVYITIETKEKDGTKYKLKKVNGQITYFSVNEKEIPAGDRNRYKDIIGKNE